jgi:hypothetical protein
VLVAIERIAEHKNIINVQSIKVSSSSCGFICCGSVVVRVVGFIVERLVVIASTEARWGGEAERKV